jgi:hypothetical protein
MTPPVAFYLVETRGTQATLHGPYQDVLREREDLQQLVESLSHQTDGLYALVVFENGEAVLELVEPSNKEEVA